MRQEKLVPKCGLKMLLNISNNEFSSSELVNIIKDVAVKIDHLRWLDIRNFCITNQKNTYNPIGHEIKTKNDTKINENAPEENMLHYAYVEEFKDTKVDQRQVALYQWLDMVDQLRDEADVDLDTKQKLRSFKSNCYKCIRKTKNEKEATVVNQTELAQTKKKKKTETIVVTCGISTFRSSIQDLTDDNLLILIWVRGIELDIPLSVQFCFTYDNLETKLDLDEEDIDNLGIQLSEIFSKYIEDIKKIKAAAVQSQFIMVGSHMLCRYKFKNAYIGDIGSIYEWQWLNEVAFYQPNKNNIKKVMKNFEERWVNSGKTEDFSKWKRQRASMTEDQKSVENSRIETFKKSKFENLYKFMLYLQRGQLNEKINGVTQMTRGSSLIQSTWATGKLEGATYYEIDKIIKSQIEIVRQKNVSDSSLVLNYHKSAVVDSWKMLKGEQFLSEFSFLPLLLSCWMIAEVCRYYQSYISTLMLLDLIYVRPDLYDFCKACVTIPTHSITIKDYDVWNNIKNEEDKRSHVVSDTFDEEYYYQLLSGQHPMANKFSADAWKPTSVIKKGLSRISTSQQKEASLIIDWLNYVVGFDKLVMTNVQENQNDITVEFITPNNKSQIKDSIVKIVKRRSMYIGQWDDKFQLPDETTVQGTDKAFDDN
jgi:hypothetical protein